MGKYKPTKADILSKRKSQIEDRDHLLLRKPDSYVHVCVTDSEGAVAGVKIRGEVRESGTYLYNLKHALEALFKHEAMRLGYFPSHPKDSVLLSPWGLMWAEDIPATGKYAGLFPEIDLATPYCPECAEETGHPDMQEKYNEQWKGTSKLTVDAERCLYCERCGFEPFKICIESGESYERQCGAWSIPNTLPDDVG